MIYEMVGKGKEALIAEKLKVSGLMVDLKFDNKKPNAIGNMFKKPKNALKVLKGIISYIANPYLTASGKEDSVNDDDPADCGPTPKRRKRKRGDSVETGPSTKSKRRKLNDGGIGIGVGAEAETEAEAVAVDKVQKAETAEEAKECGQSSFIGNVWTMFVWAGMAPTMYRQMTKRIGKAVTLWTENEKGWTEKEWSANQQK